MKPRSAAPYPGSVISGPGVSSLSTALPVGRSRGSSHGRMWRRGAPRGLPPPARHHSLSFYTRPAETTPRHRSSPPPSSPQCRSTFSSYVPYPGDGVSTPSQTLLSPFLPRSPLRSGWGELRRPGEAARAPHGPGAWLGKSPAPLTGRHCISSLCRKGQRRLRPCWYFVMSRIKSASARILL